MMVFLWKSVLCHCSDQVSGGKQLFQVFTEYKPYPHVVGCLSGYCHG